MAFGPLLYGSVDHEAGGMSSTLLTETPASRPVSPRPALVAAMLGFALLTLDTSVVNVALPAIGAGLGAGMSGLAWVVDAYTLVLAALLLSSGALADRVGASRAYGAGVAVFVLASAACGLALGLPALLAARAVQGAAAAVMLPASLALVREAYGDPRRRARAVSLWAAGGTVAVALGPVVGGALTTVWSWRGVFFVNLPLGLLALVPLTRVARSSRGTAPLDLPGQLTAMTALGALTFAAVEGGTEAWWALGLAGGSFAAFLVVESRRRHPMVPLGLFRNTTVAVAVAAGSANSVAFYGTLFVFSLFFQQVLGLSALAAGLMFLPMTGLLAGVNILSARVAARYGARLPIVLGQVVAVAGLLGLLTVDAESSRVAQALLLVPPALGVGFSLPPLIASMMEAVPAERAGTAAGLLNAVRQTAGALAVAVFGSLAARSMETALPASLLISAGLLTLTALASLRLPGPRA
ncbi:MFS transporter [Streptomyces sp. CB02261]|uniref:MFS transporter n=1 Tax=Streptomyces sp. CB02261 TaxID=1703940 RepID=UPI003FD0FF2E